MKRHGWLLWGKQKGTREHTLKKVHGDNGATLTAETRKRMHHLSPLVAPREVLAKFPSCAIMASELDPLLDDSIMFTRRLHNLGKHDQVRLKVAPLLPHGWLNMYFTGDPGSMAASAEVTAWMKQLLQNGLALAEQLQEPSSTATLSATPVTDALV